MRCILAENHPHGTMPANSRVCCLLQSYLLQRHSQRSRCPQPTEQKPSQDEVWGLCGWKGEAAGEESSPQVARPGAIHSTSISCLVHGDCSLPCIWLLVSPLVATCRVFMKLTQHYLKLASTSSGPQATCKMLNSHIWLVATMMDIQIQSTGEQWSQMPTACQLLAWSSSLAS